MSNLTKEQIGMEKISPSALDCYESCPKLFYYQNWLGLKLDEDKLHMDFGNAIHESIGHIHRLYDTNFGGGWVGQIFADVEEFFSHQWTISKIPDHTFHKYMETKKGKESGFKNKKELHQYFYDDGVAILQSYWDNKEVLLTQHGHDWSEFEIMMKQEMRNPLDQTEKLPIPLSLRIDARNRAKTKMGDFKTSGSKYDPVETRKKIQGQCYVFADFMQTGKLIGDFDYVVLRKGLKSINRVEVVPLHYDLMDMEIFYQRVKSILHKIANREFERPIIGHAGFCQCKKYDEALDVNGITS